MSSFFSSKFFNLGAKLALTLAALWFAFRGLDMAHLAEMFKQQDMQPLAEVMALMMLQIILGALRWRRVLRGLDAKVTLSRMAAFKMYYISIFFSCCLPGGSVSSDVLRVWLAKAYQIPLTVSIHSVIIDRILALGALLLLVLAGLPWLGELLGFNATPVLVVTVAVSLAGLWSFFRLERLLARFDHRRVVRWLMHFASVVHGLLVRPLLTAWLTCYALAGHIIYCVATYVLAQSIGIEISLLQVLLLSPPVILMMTMPLSIGGWGLREAGMVGMFALAGVPQSAALLLSIELGILIMVVTLPASILWFFAHRQSKQQEPHGSA